LRHLDHKAARRTIAVERSAVEAAKPKKARAKEGTGFGRAEFTGRVPGRCYVNGREAAPVASGARMPRRIGRRWRAMGAVRSERTPL
jgi:hypothetical protein